MQSQNSEDYNEIIVHLLLLVSTAELVEYSKVVPFVSVCDVVVLKT